jgi:hypothetical protein
MRLADEGREYMTRFEVVIITGSIELKFPLTQDAWSELRMPVGGVRDLMTWPDR